MTNKIFSSFKIVTLSVVLSFGLSYVYAWTAPTATPPGGNVSAPINTSATSQTKAGDLKVSGNIGIGLGASSPAQKLDVAGSAQITGTIFGGGAQTTYGATTIRGDKNGWSGINFAAASGANNGTLMMHPSYSGFYNAADNGWRWYVTNAGASVQSGSASASDFCTTGGKCLSAAGGVNASLGAAYWYHPGCGFGGPCQCPGNSIMVGTYGWWATYTDAYYLCRNILN